MSVATAEAVVGGVAALTVVEVAAVVASAVVAVANPTIVVVVASVVAVVVDLTPVAAVEAISEASRCLFAALPLEPAVDQHLFHLASTCKLPLHSL